MTPAYLWHITLETGHSRRSPRAEVDDEVVAVMAAFVVRALNSGAVAPMPGPLGYGARVSGEGGVLMVTIARLPLVPLVTFGVATRSRHSARLWRLLHDGAASPLRTDRADVPSPPWLGVRLEPGILSDPTALSWLADAERCIAWAWIERGRS